MRNASGIGEFNRSGKFWLVFGLWRLESMIRLRREVHDMKPISTFRNWWLAWLLRRAATEMRGRGSDEIPFTKFRSTLEFADFLDSAAGRVRGGDTTDGKDLWQLFAPTCDWDNADGSLRMGNLIFRAVSRRFSTA
jgi:hypothetical protein